MGLPMLAAGVDRGRIRRLAGVGGVCGIYASGAGHAGKNDPAYGQTLAVFSKSYDAVKAVTP